MLKFEDLNPHGFDSRSCTLNWAAVAKFQLGLWGVQFHSQLQFLLLDCESSHLQDVLGKCLGENLKPRETTRWCFPAYLNAWHLHSFSGPPRCGIPYARHNPGFPFNPQNSHEVQLKIIPSSPVRKWRVTCTQLVRTRVNSFSVFLGCLPRINCGCWHVLLRNSQEKAVETFMAWLWNILYIITYWRSHRAPPSVHRRGSSKVPEILWPSGKYRDTLVQYPAWSIFSCRWNI